MKKLNLLYLLPLAVMLTGCAGNKKGAGWAAFLLILALILGAFAGLRTWSFVEYCRRRRQRGRKAPKSLDMMTWCVYGLAGLALIIGLVIALTGEAKEEPVSFQDPSTTSGPVQTTPTAAPTEPPEVFEPEKSPLSDPANWDIRWEIFGDGQLLHSYTRSESISFGDPEEYFALPGVSTFRGNNYRNSATYGTAQITEKKIGTQWSKTTGPFTDSAWSGHGWTGQPLIVKWDEATKALMNLNDDKKAKADLVEVIYASLDGIIYFLDLEDGSATREPLDVGMCFKGAGTLDPRGYPLLYVGSGDENDQGERPRMFIISLIDSSILYEGGYDDALSYRTDNDSWCAFDSAPIIHAGTDTLIWPGENGILYTMKLNTQFDKTAGTLSVAPDNTVVTRYHTGRSSSQNYWYGYEPSCVVVENYLYISENGGMFFCIDLNTMELVWAQDTKDDSNSTPVFDGEALYTAPSLHWTKNSDNTGTISIYKLDAETGKILWEKPCSVHTVSGVSGGVQSSPLLGQEGTNLEGMIFYTVARTDTEDSGTLLALDTETGEGLWHLSMDDYAWSSPVALYTEDGTGYVVVCDSAGNATFIDGATGEVLDTEYLGGLVESSPAVYENMLVVGTRLRQICGLKVS